MPGESPKMSSSPKPLIFAVPCRARLGCPRSRLSFPETEADDEGIDFAYHRAQLEGIALKHHGMVELVMPDASRGWYECLRENDGDDHVGVEICGWRTRLRFETGRRHGGEAREKRRGLIGSVNASLALEVFDKVGPLARVREEEVGVGSQREAEILLRDQRDR
jgi:hypothetical protein